MQLVARFFHGEVDADHLAVLAHARLVYRQRVVRFLVEARVEHRAERGRRRLVVFQLLINYFAVQVHVIFIMRFLQELIFVLYRLRNGSRVLSQIWMVLLLLLRFYQQSLHLLLFSLRNIEFNL